MVASPEREILSEPWTFRFPYTRTTGPVVGRFLDGLRQQQVWGLRMEGGCVLVPPHAHDPVTSATLDEWVQVGTEGVLTTWTWVAKPKPKHPFDRPFAFGLVTLDGATTGFLHAVDVASPDQLATGMRVRIRWARELRGHITDIACFEPLDAPALDYEPTAVVPDKPRPVDKSMYPNPFASDYDIVAGEALEVHLRGLADKKLIGMRGPSGHVYLPPDGADPVTGGKLTEAVELPDTGTVLRFCIVNIPVRDQSVEVPFAAADVLIDGADTTFMALIRDIPLHEVRPGLRVKAVWVPDAELTMSMSNIKGFAPNGEPDRDVSDGRGKA